MRPIEDDFQFNVVVVSRHFQQIQLRLIAIHQGDPFPGLLRIAPHSLFKHLLDDRLERLFEARPTTRSAGAPL